MDRMKNLKSGLISTQYARLGECIIACDRVLYRLYGRTWNTGLPPCVPTTKSNIYSDMRVKLNILPTTL